MDGKAANRLIGYHYNGPAILLSNVKGALQCPIEYRLARRVGTLLLVVVSAARKVFVLVSVAGYS